MGPDRRGLNLTRQEDKLHAVTFGMRSFTFSLQSGEMTGWNLNANYFAFLPLFTQFPFGCRPDGSSTDGVALLV